MIDRMELGRRVVITSTDSRHERGYVGLRGTLQYPEGYDCSEEEGEIWVRMDNSNLIQETMSNPEKGYFYAYHREVSFLNPLEELAECSEDRTYD